MAANHLRSSLAHADTGSRYHRDALRCRLASRWKNGAAARIHVTTCRSEPRSWFSLVFVIVFDWNICETFEEALSTLDGGVHTTWLRKSHVSPSAIPRWIYPRCTHAAQELEPWMSEERFCLFQPWTHVRFNAITVINPHFSIKIFATIVRLTWPHRMFACIQMIYCFSSDSIFSWRIFPTKRTTQVYDKNTKLGNVAWETTHIGRIDRKMTKGSRNVAWHHSRLFRVPWLDILCPQSNPWYESSTSLIEIDRSLTEAPIGNERSWITRASSSNGLPPFWTAPKGLQ